MRAALVVVALAACGHDRSPAPPAARRDAALASDAAAVEVPARPLGLPELAKFAWRKGPGQAAFRAARRAENRDQWPAVVAACRASLTADPGHLDASWLLAIAYAKVGKLDDVLAPLAVAVAGDFGKWANPSLEHPALAPFLATATGRAWRARVEADRQTYIAALARSFVVNAGGDLYAYDGARWYRLTRTGGTVVGGLAAEHQIAYVAIELTKHGRSDKIGIADLARGRTSNPVAVDHCNALGCIGPKCFLPAELAYNAGKQPGFWLQGCSPEHWRQLDDDGAAHDLPPKTKQPAGPWLETRRRSALLHRLPVPSVMADWDATGLASAIKIATTNRVVSVLGQIDGNTATWSPDRAQLAFVAMQDEHCKPGAVGAIAFVADVATGKVTELERATGGLAVEWIGDRKLAIAGDHGVSLVELGGATTALAGATDLLAPRRKPKCSPEPEEPPPSDDEPAEAGSDEGSDAARSQ